MEPDNQPTKPPASQQHWPLHLHRRGSWLVIGLVLLVLGLVSYFGLHSQTKKPSSTAAVAKVSISPTGFLPATLSVKTGTQVTWTNTDSKAHEVAADPYPKNNSIPGFDSTQVLQTNDSYSFSFSKAGTYTYHDQLNPLKINGTVIVK